MATGKLLLQFNYTLQDIDKAAARLIHAAEGSGIITFSGDMGAGKTTFITRLCAAMGIADRVSSPTFALINEYHTLNTELIVYHMDWYRLKDEEEAISAGMEDCLLQAAKGRATCLVEWPEKAPGILRAPHISVTIAATGPEDREMKIWQMEK